MNTLFRKEALEFRSKSLQGQVMVLPQLSHTLGVGFILLWVIALTLWLALSSYAKKETVQGWLEPPEGVIKVYAQGDGIITEVLVSEGDTVEKDQALIVVNGDRQLTGGGQLESQLLQEYMEQKKLLQQQLQRSDTMYAMRLQDVNQRIAAAQQDLELILQQQDTMQQRLDLISDQLHDFERLEEKGHASTFEKNRAKQEQLTLTSELQALSRSKVNQKNTLQQLENEKRLLPGEQANSVDRLTAEISQLNSEITRINARRAYVIKAAQAGIVNNLQAKPGKRPGNNVPLLSILPRDSRLTINLLVPVRAAGFVDEKQAIDIRFDAFPYQKFGLYRGQINHVSNAVLLPNEQGEFPVRVSEPVYIVHGQLEFQYVKSGKKQFPLKTGMTLSADIQLESRSIFQWLLEPLFSLQGRL